METFQWQTLSRLLSFKSNTSKFPSIRIDEYDQRILLVHDAIEKSSPRQINGRFKWRYVKYLNSQLRPICLIKEFLFCFKHRF